MIYLDNAATSFPKPRSVIAEVNKYIRRDCGNPGRSGHRLAARAAEAVYLAREEIADFFGTKNPEHVIFTSNATHALNLAIKSQITPFCHVLCSDMEHNSVIRPLERLRRDIGVEYSSFSLEDDLYANLTEAVRDNTEAIVCTLASNVTGKKADIQALSRFARERGLKLILDASQLAGHEKIDLAKTPCTALCAPGHKGLFGLQGSGFVIFDKDYDTDGLMEGGSGFDSVSTDMPRILPERYEAGTLATPPIVSLATGVRFIRSVGIDNISSRLCTLTDSALNALRDIAKVRVLGAEGGIVCFNVANIPSSRVEAELDRLGICVRSGLHCAPSAHRLLGTLDGGAVRVSFSYFNRETDVNRLTDAILKIAKGM